MWELCSAYSQARAVDVMCRAHPCLHLKFGTCLHLKHASNSLSISNPYSKYLSTVTFWETKRVEYGGGNSSTSCEKSTILQFLEHLKPL